ncbi:MAG TPA: tetratricopeptide repeat protein [Pseudomonadales bacterium]|nr:tetratricopeptide repeat protein [Pseudomonadales bacterium]
MRWACLPLPALLLAASLLGLGLSIAASAGQERVRTTSPAIALKNLDYGVERARLMLDARPGDATLLSAYVDALLTRVRFLDSFDDFEPALAATARALELQPQDPRIRMERARVLQALHRFDEAGMLLDTTAAGLQSTPSPLADALGPTLDLQRQTIALARGDARGVLAHLADGSLSGNRFADGTLAGAALAALGRREEADAALAEALVDWDHITPFAIAWIEFQRGEVWVGVDDARAEQHYTTALDYMPAYVTARVHLAELLMARGALQAAIDLLTPVADGANPEPAARLAEFLAARGETQAAQRRAAQAERGWSALLERHPLAFADHAAEFWLGAGADPGRALVWARRNHANRPTERALALLLDAQMAAGQADCGRLATAAAPSSPSLAESVSRLEAACSGP